MLATSLDVLYISLAIGFIVLVIFISIALFYLILILRDTTKIVDKARDTVDAVNEYILSPVQFVYGLYEKFGPMIETLIEKAAKKK